jgi:toxin FitB
LSDTAFLVDTNVITEARRKRPEPKVVAFMQSVRPERLFVSVLTLGELRKGAEMRARKDRSQGADIHRWIDEVESEFGKRALPINQSIARLWGELASVRPRPVVDTLIAATAIIHGLTLLTRNIPDIADTGVVTINPWH